MRQAVLGITLALYVAMSALHVIYLGAPWGSTAVPDMRMLGYSPQDVRFFLDGLGSSETRWIFFDVLGWLDTVFPACLTLALVLIFQGLDPSAGRARTWIYAVFPVAYMLTDYYENSRLDRLRVPLNASDFEAIVQIASVATVTKFALLEVALVPIIWRIVKRIRRTEQEG